MVSNIFQVCVGEVRVWAIFCVASAFVAGILLMKKETPVHIRAVISMAFCSLSSWTYEIFLIVLVYSSVGDTSGMVAIPKYSVVSLVIIFVIYMMNRSGNNIRFNAVPLLVILLTYVVVNLTLYNNGWYAKMYLWCIDQTLPDPHYWLTGLSKFLGFWWWIPLVKDGGKV